MTRREARVSNSGCGIFLTDSELRVLGIDPDNSDCVTYSVTESGVSVESAGGAE